MYYEEKISKGKSDGNVVKFWWRFKPNLKKIEENSIENSEGNFKGISERNFERNSKVKILENISTVTNLWFPK